MKKRVDSGMENWRRRSKPGSLAVSDQAERVAQYS